MTWIDETLERARSPIYINDSKTPSGVAHVGSLRGILTHDALLRVARGGGAQARFTYGCDDMDPVDEIPHGMGEYFREHLGKPLYAAPPPPELAGETELAGKNMAQAYFAEFTSNFEPLGVDAEFYYMSDIYRAGRLDDTIDTFLRRASVVREIYLRETGAVRPDDWLPFQPICGRCGRIGTTFASDYDGETVAYQCLPDLVAWAQGCGATGRVSPFGGAGKLPWKLEWVAKWKVLPVTVEGAGKDHMGAGGSHKVAAALAREVLECPVPTSFAYEFFTLGGAKMSSSKGIGLSASELVACLPPQLLRYLVLKVQVRRALDFDLDLATLNGAFAEYERLWNSVYEGNANSNQQQLFAISQLVDATETASPPAYSPPFDSVVSVVQQPHIDLSAHVAALGVGPLSDADRDWIDVKRLTANAWSQRFSESASRLMVADDLPRATEDLSNQQRGFLCVSQRLLGELETWQAATIQATLFDAARIVGITPAEAFVALYTAFFGWPQGPRAGSFLEFLGRGPACERLGEVTFSYPELVAVTAMELDDWNRAVTTAATEQYEISILPNWIPESDDSGKLANSGVLELFVADAKGRMSAHRTVLEGTEATIAQAARGHVARLLGIAEAEVPIRPDNPFG
ncbi:MAG: lysine--tRNA ligase [Acidimicrobiaceae bacterium]|nr:lysine--tRNA ligase [Acidimicrobiaceae bacterium]